MKNYPPPAPDGVHYPPQPTIHDASCPDAPDRDVMATAVVLRDHPYAIPHRCVREWATPPRVVVDHRPPPTHDYEMSMLWPVNAVRYLCITCRGTHSGQE